MCCALYQRLIQVEKLVFLPFKAGACMWALIVISKELSILVHHKNVVGFTVDFKLETFAAGVFDISGFAENVAHNVW